MQYEAEAIAGRARGGPDSPISSLSYGVRPRADSAALRPGVCGPKTGYVCDGGVAAHVNTILLGGE